MAKRRLRVGFDFDGVVAYNPLRVARLPVSLFKSFLVGEKKTTFFVPKNPVSRRVWELFHDSSFLAAPGLDLLRKLSQQGDIEAYLISGRFGYLEDHLMRWLKAKGAKDLFKAIHLNKKDEQPHVFKKGELAKLNLDIYIEDNWDIVTYLIEQQSKVAIYWITNILDRFKFYPYKYNSLKSALEDLDRRNSISAKRSRKQ